VIFQDFPGPGIFKKKKSRNIQDFPGGMGTLDKGVFVVSILSTLRLLWFDLFTCQPFQFSAF